MDIPNLNIPSEYFYLALVICLIMITFFFVRLVIKVVSTLKKLDNTIELANKRINEIGPVVDGLIKIEDKLNETLGLIDLQLDKTQRDISRLLDELIGTLSDYRRLEKGLEERINNEVPPILDETKDLVAGVNEVAKDIETKIKSTDNLFKAIDEAGQTVRMVTGIVKGGFTGLAIQLASMAVGVKRSLEYVSENIHAKEVKKDE